MTPEEFEIEQTKRPVRQTTCDPCQIARVPRRRLGHSNETLDDTRCIMVDDEGFAQFMVLTDDGRWVKAEEY